MVHGGSSVAHHCWTLGYGTGHLPMLGPHLISFLCPGCHSAQQKMTSWMTPGADFTNGLKPGFGLKFKTLVLNSVKNVLSRRA